jgi:SOS response associated peptidase (SRAP)
VQRNYGGKAQSRCRAGIQTTAAEDQAAQLQGSLPQVKLGAAQTEWLMVMRTIHALRSALNPRAISSPRRLWQRTKRTAHPARVGASQIGSRDQRIGGQRTALISATACVLPVDGFYEWKAIKGQRAKQPYAIAMKDGRPFGIGGIWENWRDPASDEWIRTFAVITTDANEIVPEIHDRMPLILSPTDYIRWLSETSPIQAT